MILTKAYTRCRKWKTSNYQAALGRLRAARAQIERDLDALEMERDRRARGRRELESNSAVTRITRIKWVCSMRGK